MHLPRWLRRLFGERRSIHNPAVPLTSSVILEYLGAIATSTSGIHVNGRTLLTYSPVWQATSLIARDIAKLPFLVWRRTGGRDASASVEALEHPAYKLLVVSTGIRTPNHWLKAMLHSGLLYGNGYSWIRRNGGGEPIELVWLEPDTIKIRHERGRVLYERSREDETLPPGVPTVILPDEMFHLRGLAPDGLDGASIIQHARDSIGRNLAVERYAADFFANSAEPGGYFAHPAAMGEEAIKNFLASWNRLHAGPGNRHKAAVLEEGMEWKTVGVSPEDALLVEAMGFGVKEVARWFNIPAHKLGDNTKTSYSSIEQENRAYFDSTLCPWISDLEIEANAKLLTTAQQNTQSHYVRATTSELLRADTKTRMESHKLAIEAGIKSPNEVRAEEGLNPYEGGDDFIRPMNMQTVDEAAAAAEAALEQQNNPPPDSPPNEPPPDEEDASGET